MPIEIRELVIKTEVRSENQPAANGGQPSFDTEQFRQQLLQQCKQMINKHLSDQKER